MFYDTSYSVNSANLGPWGDAIVTELIPYLENNFSIISEPWARALAGGSTGGWESLAMQIFYPDFFGGTWPLCADSLDFNYHQIVNIYENENAYYIDQDWYKVERPSCRSIDGNIQWTIKDECLWEAAVGGVEHPISLGQWAIWEAVYGPKGEDGYPKRLWDPLTGVIDHEVAAYWKDNFDLNAILQKKWTEIGTSLLARYIYAAEIWTTTTLTSPNTKWATGWKQLKSHIMMVIPSLSPAKVIQVISPTRNCSMKLLSI